MMNFRVARKVYGSNLMTCGTINIPDNQTKPLIQKNFIFDIGML